MMQEAVAIINSNIDMAPLALLVHAAGLQAGPYRREGERHPPSRQAPMCVREMSPGRPLCLP